MVSSGVVAAIHVAGVRCDPCGAMQRISVKGYIKCKMLFFENKFHLWK